MIKSCRRYWTREIADSIVQLKQIRFDNPMFSLATTFDRQDFTRLLTEQFEVPAATVDEFFDAARKMNFYDDQAITTGQLFERFFPGRDDVVRLLMEPITYANGSTLEDPALTYGIVFSNFMSKGVYTFQGGTDRLIKLMGEDLTRNGVDVRTRCNVEKIHVAGRRVEGVTAAGRFIKARAVLSNANLKGTVFGLVVIDPGPRLRGPRGDRQDGFLPPVPAHDGDIDAGERCRHPLHPGHAGPRQARHDADLHASFDPKAERDSRSDPSGKDRTAGAKRPAEAG